MKKTIRLLFAISSFLFLSLPAAASAPDDSIISCPTSITCYYDSGVCDFISPEMNITYSGPYFSGQRVFDLLGMGVINEVFTINSRYPYLLGCLYLANDRDNGSGISLYSYASELTGSNWVFSGFGKKEATCSDVTNPTECSGIKR